MAREMHRPLFSSSVTSQATRHTPSSEDFLKLEPEFLEDDLIISTPSKKTNRIAYVYSMTTPTPYVIQCQIMVG